MAAVAFLDSSAFRGLSVIPIGTLASVSPPHVSGECVCKRMYLGIDSNMGYFSIVVLSSEVIGCKIAIWCFEFSFGGQIDAGFFFKPGYPLHPPILPMQQPV